MSARKLVSVFAIISIYATGIAFASKDTPERPSVSTLAGSGRLDSSDGRNASFTMPVGLAYDSSGRLFVSDSAAQRIRVIETDGSVRTFAGPNAPTNGMPWIAGGYRDGAAAVAKFNWPLGLLVGRRGELYVADSQNHCVRVIEHGLVSTFSGVPGKAGFADGPRGVATMLTPTALAEDAQGNLYVADRAGIRKVDPQGNVLTIPGLGHHPFAVASRNGPLGTILFVADEDGIVKRYGTDRRFASIYAGKKSTPLGVLGDRDIGNAFGMQALDDYTVIYSDPRTESIRLLETYSGETEVLAGDSDSDGAANGASFVDGRWNTARFFAPAGIAISPDGRIAIADAGNRRIRILSKFNRPFDPWRSFGDEMFSAANLDRSKTAFRIAYVGASQVYSDTDWSDSIEGVLQKRLEQVAARIQKPIHVLPALAPAVVLSALQSYAAEVADAHLFDVLVFHVNTYSIPTATDVRQNDQMRSGVEALRNLYRRLANAHIRLLIVTQPMPTEFSPSEYFWRFALSGEVVSDSNTKAYRALVDMVVRSGVPTVDLMPAFMRAENGDRPKALFGSSDFHLSAYGRAVVGNDVADFMLRDAARWLRPWPLH